MENLNNGNVFSEINLVKVMYKLGSNNTLLTVSEQKECMENIHVLTAE